MEKPKNDEGDEQVRSMKKTSLSFGLVNIPVRLYKAVGTHDIGFHQHHDADKGRIGYQKVCKDCGEVVAPQNIVKGIEHNGQVVIVTDEEMASLADEQGPQIEVVQFAHAGEIDPITYETPYYLEPDGASEGYALLHRVLGETERIAVVRFTLRGDKTHLGVLRVLDDLLVIHSILWPDEVRDPSVLKVDNSSVKLKPQMVKMAHALVESMLMEFDPAEYQDGYTERLGELIEAKAQDVGFETHAQDLDGVPDSEVQDLLKQLEASVKRHPAGKARGKKAAPRKAPVRRKKIA